MGYEGQTFATRNSVVKTLPPGSVLEVVGPGQLQVLEVAEEQFKPGDRIKSKYGPATVVRLSSRFDGDVDTDQVFYVADGTNVVRIAQSAVSRL